MWITKAKRAVCRCFLLVAIVGASSAACGDKKDDSGQSKTETPTQVTATEPSEPAGGSPKKPGDVPEPPAPDLASIDVSFLVEPCVDSGLAEEACRCAGEEAKTTIGHELLAKMSKAPDDGDPAIKTYYQVPEMQKIMAWVDGAGIKCGLEEEE